MDNFKENLIENLRIYKLQLILSGVALVAVILTVLLINGDNNAQGLYITAASGEVSITDSSGSPTSAARDSRLKKDDIVTTGNGNCVITYKSKNSEEDNYIILAPYSQLVITDTLTGKNNGGVMLNQGSVICDYKNYDKLTIDIRTANCLVEPKDTVTRVAYNDGDQEFTTDIQTFMGNSKIQLYDQFGTKVNEVELLAEQTRASVRTGDATDDSIGGPMFLYLNLPIQLEILPPFALKELITISQNHDSFPYTAGEIRAAYEFAAEDFELEPFDDPFNSDSFDDPFDDPDHTQPEVTGPAQTSPANTTTAFDWEHPTTVPPRPTVTDPPATTPAQTQPYDPDNDTMYNVIIVIGDEESIQEVRHGDSADKPADPYIPGRTFTGWDKSFDNITQDTVITAIFEDDNGGWYNENTHTVTLIVADKTTTMQVEHGKAADIPPVIQVDGYIFLGWDNDFYNVTSDITVTAILQPVQQEYTPEYIVNFVIDGSYHPTRVKHGDTAIPPLMPTFDSEGRQFYSWDKPLTDITSNTTITALYY